MRRGPKLAPTGSLDLDGWPEDRVERALRFGREFCGLDWRPWQEAFVGAFLAAGVRTGLLAIPRKNGKTQIAAVLSLFGLLADTAQGEDREVLLVSVDERTAGYLFRRCVRIVERDERLAACVQVFVNRIEHPESGSILEFLPGEERRVQGRSPTMAVCDELHVMDAATWEAMTTAGGARRFPLVLGLTTAGADRSAFLFELLGRAREATDPSMVLVEFAAPGAALEDEDAWAAANPALGDFLDADHLRAQLRSVRPAAFKRYHLNEWAADGDRWIEPEAWERLSAPREVPKGARIVLGFDGSASGDSTVLVGCTIDDPYVFVLGGWERTDDPRWRVPRADVDEAVAAAFDAFDVIEMACDPWGWRDSLDRWSTRWPERVIEWPTNVIGRMAPATDRFRVAVIEGQLAHDGSELLARHVRNAVAKRTAQGDLIYKDRKSSPRKIDAAVAAIVAFDRAAWHSSRPSRRLKVVAF